MVLLCNDPKGCDALLESLKGISLARLDAWEAMRKKGGRDLRKSVAYREAQALLSVMKTGFEKAEMGTIVPISENPPSAA
jgi:hypothetical protein